MSENATAEKAENTATSPRVLNDYEVRVFAAAIDAKNSNGWCDEGFNQTMRKLGLPTKPAQPSNSGTVTVTVPTTGTVTYRLSRDVTTEEQAREAIAKMVERDQTSVQRQNGLRYGTRGPAVTFDVANATFTGLPDGTDHRTDEQKQWDAAIEQVKALNDGTATEDEDGDDDGSDY